MYFNRIKETSDYLLKGELYTDTELEKYVIDADCERINIPKSHTIKINGHRFELGVKND